MGIYLLVAKILLFCSEVKPVVAITKGTLCFWQYSKILNGISYLEKFYKKREKLNTPDKPMLKIGGGSGFLATTIGLKIKEHDDYNFDDYFEKVRSITKGKSYDYCFPKSRKVTFRGGYPLGWVQLSFN